MKKETTLTGATDEQFAQEFRKRKPAGVALSLHTEGYNLYTARNYSDPTLFGHGKTITEAVADLPSEVDARRARIAQLKDELAKLEGEG